MIFKDAKKILHTCTRFYILIGLERLLRYFNRNKLIILMYHGVVNKGDPQSNKKNLYIETDKFEKQVRFLTKRYHITSFRDFQTKKIVNPLILTFDDGYQNNYEFVYPILKKYHIPATIFLVFKNIGKKGYLSWKEIKEMQKNNIEFGSHTLTHPVLTEISLIKAKKEIFDSKKELEKKLNEPVQIFAYPYGSFNQQIKKLTKQAEYKLALTVKFGKNKDLNNFYLKRIPIHNQHSLEIFILSLAFNMHNLLYKLSPWLSKKC